jgi:hypothetical protein
VGRYAAGTHIEVAFEHPANAGVLRHLRGMRSLSVAGNVPACAPESIKDVYLNLGTHPELVG